MATKFLLRTIYTVSSESSGIGVWQIMSEYNEPYVFVRESTKDSRIVGYIRNTDLIAFANDAVWMTQQVTELPLRRNFTQIQAESLDLFRVFGEEVVVILNDSGQPEGYLQREDMLYYLLTSHSSGGNWIRSLLNSIPMGIAIVDPYGKVENFSPEVLRMLRVTPEDLTHQKIGEILEQNVFQEVIAKGESILNHVIVNERLGVIADFGPIKDKNGRIRGAIIVLQDLPYIEKMAMELEYVKNLNTDLHAVLSSIYDEIIVVDGQGVLLRYSGNLIQDFWEIDKEQLIGINLMELEHEGTFFSSIVKMVLNRRKKISITQESQSGKSVLAVGNPVFSSAGKLERIVIALRDITETIHLKEELRYAKRMSKKYKQELEYLKEQRKYIGDRQLIYCSEKIESVLKNIHKVAKVSSTVLLTGESGVGKEVFARVISALGPRREKPFVKVNCGAIPENLLESELFGYEKGAFTGAIMGGKAGYFQMAHLGILFLDEIAELPFNLQVKLLRFLQEREVTPVGGTKAIDVDVQIIAATNRNLERMVEEGSFREDLYYRLNVIPIYIPPLRERPEDIPLLSLHFIKQFNDKYQKNCQLSQDALDLLESHAWPGNVRELQNLIERLAVTAEEELIGSPQILPLLRKVKKQAGGSKANKILPLKEATEAIEEQMIKLAMEEYRTTSMAAQALGVSQSTISRKYQRILNKVKREEQ